MPTNNATMPLVNNTVNYETHKILLIEDNPGDARLVGIYLDQASGDYEVQNVTTLEEGKELLNKENFAAILLDLILPDSTGLSTVKNLLKAHPNENVIVMTGHTTKFGLEAVQAGAQDFLEKDTMNAEKLNQTLQYSIERQKIVKRLEEAQKIAHIGNWEYDLRNKRLQVSNEMYRIFGYAPKSQVLTTSLLSKHIYQEEGQYTDIFLSFCQAAINKEDVATEFKIHTNKAHTKYVSFRCNVIKDRDGGAPIKVTGILQDITESKEAQQRELSSQQRYETIFNQSKDAIFIISESGQLVVHNPATVDLFGYSSEELKQMNLERVFEKSIFFEDFIQKMAENKDAYEEVNIRQKNDEIRNCQWTINVYETEEFRGYQCIIRDITEIKRTANLIKAKEISDRASILKEQFLATVSHEMRTPMNGILGMSHLFLKTDMTKEQANYITSIKRSSEHLLGIINDILEISKLQFGNVELEHKIFDLQDLLTNLMNIIQYRVEEKGLSFDLIMDDDIDKKLIGDHLRLNQILLNLTMNAVKFTEEGFVKLRIKKTSGNDTHMRLRFEIQDTGIGISKDKQSLVFESFTQVSQDYKKLFGGTGLGLAIVKQLVERQEGLLGMDSELGVGSTFWFELEFEKTKGEQVDDNQEENKRVELQFDGPIKVLLVEDHKLNQVVAKRTLEKEWESNVEVTIADNGKIATEIFAQRQDFDIVLMDIQMPIMDGYETTKYIRENIQSNKELLPILAMTAHAFIARENKYQDYGMNDFVLKPFEPDHLFNKIAQYFNLKRKTEQMDNNTTTTINIDSQELVIDTSYLDDMAGGDKDMKKMMLEMLFEEPLHDIRQMFIQSTEQQFEEIFKISHKLKSTFMYAHIEGLQALNKKITLTTRRQFILEQFPEFLPLHKIDDIKKLVREEKWADLKDLSESDSLTITKDEELVAIDIHISRSRMRQEASEKLPKMINEVMSMYEQIVEGLKKIHCQL